jgi:hypothetical protein
MDRQEQKIRKGTNMIRTTRNLLAALCLVVLLSAGLAALSITLGTDYSASSPTLIDKWSIVLGII